MQTNKIFNKVNVEISNICNLQCSFCPEVHRSKQMMDPQLFARVIEQIAPLTRLVCFHLMGEPLVHPQFEQLVAICREQGVQIFLVSNGVLLRDQKSDVLLDPIFYQLNFSLHSFFDNFSDRDPTTYLDRIFRLTHRALKERPTLYVNYRLWNLESPESDLIQNQKMLERVQSEFGFELPDSVDARRQKSFRVQGRLYLHFDTKFVWPSLDLPILGSQGTCYGLTHHFGVLVDGTVVPCCLDQEGRIPLGNLSEQPILEILGSERAQNILNGFRHGKLVENLCQRCQYVERFAARATQLQKSET